MRLKVLGSSSSGNCYIFENENEALILEAGIAFRDVKKALDFNLRKVVGCLVTHRHNDHAKHIKAMVDSGFYTLALADVWAAKGIQDPRAISIAPGKGYCLGGFKVLAYRTFHDVPCVGYLIEHNDCGKVMFLTDSYMCDCRFRDLNHVLIECNYSNKKLMEAIAEHRTMMFQRERLQVSHMELSETKEILATTDLSKVEQIVLIHLSENNGDAPLFVSEIERLTGKPVYAASKGLTIELMRL